MTSHDFVERGLRRALRVRDGIAGLGRKQHGDMEDNVGIKRRRVAVSVDTRSRVKIGE